MKESLLWLFCGACGREARECGQRGGRGASLVHGLSTRPAGRGLARRARPQQNAPRSMQVGAARQVLPQPQPPFNGDGTLRLRRDSPLSSMRQALWTMRSRTASATVGSAITFGQRSTGIWRTQFACDDWKRWPLRRDNQDESHEFGGGSGRRNEFFSRPPAPPGMVWAMTPPPSDAFLAGSCSTDARSRRLARRGA